MKQPEKISFFGWPIRLRLFNANLELVVTADVGPRGVGCGGPMAIRR
jgi:hypothetical protein